MLPPAMPVLGYLKALKLEHMEFDAFPASLAASLRSLTELKLGHNHFTQLPGAVTLMTTLQTLDMSYNQSLQLSDSDALVLAALPLLQSVDFSMERRFFESVAIPSAIKSQMPHLIVYGPY